MKFIITRSDVSVDPSVRLDQCEHSVSYCNWTSAWVLIMKRCFMNSACVRFAGGRVCGRVCGGLLHGVKKITKCIIITAKQFDKTLPH